MKLYLEQLSKNFGDKTILQQVDYTFEQGKIYGLLGRNGVGKTTLFNCLSREMELDEGKVMIELNGVIRPLEEQDVGYVYSLPILPEFLTGYEFIKFFMDVNEHRLSDRRSIDEYFDMMGMSVEDRHRLIKSYSHGMKNKVQMLLFLITKPPVILLDEPLTSFDVIVALEMKNMLKEMKREHIIIFSTHILQLAKDLCDELVVQNHYKLTSVSTEILRNPDYEQDVIQMLKAESVTTNE